MFKGGVAQKSKIIGLVIVLLFVSSLIGLYLWNVQRQTKISEGLEANIKSYQEALANNEWTQAENYLSGEALLLHQKNTMSLKDPIKAVLKDFKLEGLQAINDNEAVVEARSIVEMVGSQLEENHYRYYLHKTATWKIYRAEELPEGLPQGLDQEKMPLLKSLVERVIKNITTGEWQMALNDLTGQARREAERTIATGQKPIITEIKNLVITPISIDDSLAWIRASYELLPSPMNPGGGQIIMNIRLKNLLGQWRVYRTEIIQLEAME